MKKLHNKIRELIVIYLRVSSAEQANNGLSLGTQKDECVKWAEKHDYDTVIFEEKGKSGANMNRPELKAMLNFIKQNKVKCILVWKLDRLTRSQRDFYGSIIPKIEKANCTIASIYENFEDVFTMDELLLSVWLGQAEKELKNIKSRTSVVIKNRKEHGYFHGKAPVGYLNTRDENRHGIIIPNPQNSHYIKRIFELYATGTFSMDRLGKEIAKYGFVSSKNLPYPKKRIEDILKNPVYAGKIVYNGNTVLGKHEPIISEELFYRVKLMFNSAKKKKPRGETYVYSNYIKCSKCGYAMIGTTKHGAHNSGTYIYYHCSNYSKFHKNEKNINEKDLDKAMQEVLNSFQITDLELQKVKKQIYTVIDELKTYENKSLEELKKQYKTISNTISNGLKQKLSGELTVSETTFKELMIQWEKEKDELNHQIQYLTENSKDRITRINVLTDFANRIPELYMKANLDEKRLILSTIADEIFYDEETNTLKIKLRPVFEQLRQRKVQNKEQVSTDKKVLTGTSIISLHKEFEKHTNPQEDFNKIIDFGTRKEQINSKKEPHCVGSKKLNVDGGT